MCSYGAVTISKDFIAIFEVVSACLEDDLSRSLRLRLKNLLSRHKNAGLEGLRKLNVLYSCWAMM